MHNEIKARIDYGKLKDIAREMAKQYKVKVGLLAESGGGIPVSENMDLAGLGVVQEYGADIKITPKMAKFLAIRAKELGLPQKQGKGDGYVHIPARSWLYEPIVGAKNKLMTKIKKELEGSFGIEFIEEYKDFELLAESIGAAALDQIQEAFANSGINGEWTPNSPMTIAGKGSYMPLIGKSGDLSRQITYKVEKNV